jgi:hypothetical protein
MSILMPKEDKMEFEDAPQGTHLGVCYRVIDLGTQLSNFGKMQRKIMQSWELPEEKMTDGRPFSIHKKYTLSSNEKATLRLHLEAWRGKAFTDEEFGTFDLGKLIGVPCLINILHKKEGDKTFVNIGGIMKCPKGTVVPALVNETIYFSLNNFDQAVYDKLSDNMKLAISKSPEYMQIKGPKPQNETVVEEHDDLSDSIPF